MRRVQIHVAAIVLCLWSLALLGDDRPSAEKIDGRLSKGDRAPYFESTSDAGMKWVSSRYASKSILVVYFYQADMTRSCTN